MGTSGVGVSMLSKIFDDDLCARRVSYDCVRMLVVSSPSVVSRRSMLSAAILFGHVLDLCLFFVLN